MVGNLLPYRIARHRNFYYGWCVLVAAVLGIACGCSSATGKQVVPDVGIESGNSNSPFDLKIVQDLNDGHDLTVVADVIPRVPWMAGPVAVRLAVLEEGITKTTQIVSLESDDANAVALASGKSVQVRLVAPVGQGSDYQLDLLWGEEAKPYIAELGQKNKQNAMGSRGPVELRRVSVSRQGKECTPTYCNVHFTVAGELENVGGSSLSEIILGVGFRAQGGDKLDFSQNLPENEERVEITGLQLAPGVSRPFEFEVSPPPGGVLTSSLEPIVRVLHAQ